MRLRAIVVPVVVIGTLQLAGCTSDTPTSTPPGGTYRSTSAGANFDQSVERNDEADATIAPFTLRQAHRPVHSPDTIYIAAGSEGLVVSTDGGQTWQVVTTPLANVSDVVALANGVIVAAGRAGEGQGFVIRSIDDGKSWETVLTIPVPTDTRGFSLFGGSSTNAQSVVITLSSDPLNPDRVLAGTSLGNILAGEQSAKTWRTIHTLTTGTFAPSADRTKLAISDLIPSPHREGELLVITAAGSLFRISEEQAELKIPRELVNPPPFGGSGSRKQVLSATYIPEFPSALLVGTDDGAVISRNLGEDWEQLALPVDTIQDFNTSVVTVSPTNSSRLLIGINSVLYRSEDGGSNWNTFSFGLTTHAITSLLIDPANAANVLAVLTPIRS